MNYNIDFVDTLGLGKVVYVDVRSEGEYAEDHIPGAVNLPVFNNEERAEIGTVYRQVSKAAARRLGLSVLAPKLPTLIDQIALLAEGSQVVLYCWRGGMRSQAIWEVCKMMRIPALYLNGGYKGYRSWVNEYWQQPFSFSVVVLHGLTGVGKTQIIKKLQSLGLQALDLEGLANNRGSVFGSIGLYKQPSQKSFESQLCLSLRGCNIEKPVIVECESKRIGRLLLPDNFFRAMGIGCHILLYDNVENRISKILADYQPERWQEDILVAIRRLEKWLGKKNVKNLTDDILKGAYEEVVKKLLLDYYDPMYSYPSCFSDAYDLSVDAGDIDIASKKIADFLGFKGGEKFGARLFETNGRMA